MVLTVPRWFPGALGALALVVFFAPLLWLALQSAIGLARPPEDYPGSPGPPYRAGAEPPRPAAPRSRGEWWGFARGALTAALCNAISGERWRGVAALAALLVAAEVVQRWRLGRVRP